MGALLGLAVGVDVIGNSLGLAVGADVVGDLLGFADRLAVAGLTKGVKMNPEEEVYSPKLSIDDPVVGAFTTRQPLEELAAFTPVNSTPIHQPPSRI